MQGPFISLLANAYPGEVIIASLAKAVEQKADQITSFHNDHAYEEGVIH